MKIVCIGRNYVEHILELNNSIPDAPVFFMKPETALLCNPTVLRLPHFSDEVHYELELVVEICKKGKNIPVHEAGTYYDKIGLGIDLTARDIQKKLKEGGLPWEKSKAFDDSAIVSTLFPTGDFNRPFEFELQINEIVKQKGSSDMMIYDIEHIISHASEYFTLLPGDLIYTGTPGGVGKLASGHRLTATLENKNLLDFNVL